MSLQLNGPRESLHLSAQDWLAVLALARRYGWRDDFGHALGQVTLPRALREALPDVPHHDAVHEKYKRPGTPGNLNIYEWFSGPHGRHILERVIRIYESGIVSMAADA